jgi:transcriptional regulator with XRE-family HTH domain
MKERPDPIDVHVGRRLRERRAVLGLSQERLGDLLGITFQQIQKYERGSNRIGSSRLFQLGKVMGVPVAFFFEGVPEALYVAPQQPPGLAEDTAGFDMSGALGDRDVEIPGDVPGFFQHRDVLELVRAYHRISDPLVRRRLFELAKALGTIEYAPTGPDGPAA